MIRVFAKVLSEVMNWSSMALSKSQTFSCWSTEPRIPAEILVLMNLTLSQLDRSHRSYSTMSVGLLSSVIAIGSSGLGIIKKGDG